MNEIQHASSKAPLSPGLNKVTFDSEGEMLVGNLFLPLDFSGEPLPGLVVAGSWTTVKEQMAGLYARRFADKGFAALAFDFRHTGESGGGPRHLEDPLSKVQDLKNAAAFLES